MNTEKLEKKFSLKFIELNNSLKESFSNVKEEILELKRTRNNNLFEIEKMRTELNSKISEEDFYSITKNLSDRIDRCALLDQVDKNMDLLNEDIREIKAEIKRANFLQDHIKELNQLKGEVEAVKGKKTDVIEFNKITNNFSRDLENFKKDIKNYKYLEKQLTKINSKVNDLEFRDKKASSREFEKKARELKKMIQKLERDFIQIEEFNDGLSLLSDRITSLESEIKNTKTNFVKDIHFNKEIANTKKLMNSIKKELDEYATKKDLERIKKTVKKNGKKVIKAVKNPKKQKSQKKNKKRKRKGFFGKAIDWLFEEE